MLWFVTHRGHTCIFIRCIFLSNHLPPHQCSAFDRDARDWVNGGNEEILLLLLCPISSLTWTLGGRRDATLIEHCKCLSRSDSSNMRCRRCLWLNWNTVSVYTCFVVYLTFVTFTLTMNCDAGQSDSGSSRVQWKLISDLNSTNYICSEHNTYTKSPSFPLHSGLCDEWDYFAIRVGNWQIIKLTLI